MTPLNPDSWEHPARGIQSVGHPVIDAVPVQLQSDGRRVMEERILVVGITSRVSHWANILMMYVIRSGGTETEVSCQCACTIGLVLYLQSLGSRVFLSDISHLSDGLGQCSRVPPNLSLRSDTIWRLLFQKKNNAAWQRGAGTTSCDWTQSALNLAILVESTVSIDEA